MQTELAKRPSNIIIFLAIIILFSSVGFVAANTAFLVSDKIYEGVSVDGIPVGGLSMTEARDKIAASFQKSTEKMPVLTFEYAGRTWSAAAADIALSIDPEELARTAFSVGRRGGLINRLQERYLTINKGFELPLNVNFDDIKLKALVTRIASEVDVKARNAIINFYGSKIVVTPDVTGLHTNVDMVINQTQEALIKHLPATVRLSVNEERPTILASDLNGIDAMLASYTTQFSTLDQNRTQNIVIAARGINEILVKKGESLSFNTLVGQRLEENGFKEAPVFINGELTPDWGGGVCQVSTTLYNASLLANMDIVERTAHPRAPGYVPLGQDATVADNLLDFRFKNNTPYNVYIMSEMGDGQITVRIYGHQTKDAPDIYIDNSDHKVIEPSTIIKQDPALELGKQVIDTEGQKGFFVNTYRVKMLNGREIDRELLGSDEYKSQDRIVKIGTKVPPKQSVK